MNDELAAPLIVGFVSDLMATARISAVARQHHYRLAWIEGAEALGAADEGMANVPGESLFGREGRLIERLVRWQPAMLIFDLANEAIPWQRWIAVLKSSPATRRIPILCFGFHEEVASLQAARDVGADVVVSRARFAASLPALLENHARLTDHVALAGSCRQPLSAPALEGIRLMNARLFYQAHEALEEAWNEDRSPGRNLYRGVLQLAVAYLQIERGNYNGAVKMLLRVRQWLGPLPRQCRGLNVAQLRQDIERVHQALLMLGPERVAQFDWELFRPAELVSVEEP